jgi:hypothetical protein
MGGEERKRGGGKRRIKVEDMERREGKGTVERGPIYQINIV